MCVSAVLLRVHLGVYLCVKARMCTRGVCVQAPLCPRACSSVREKVCMYMCVCVHVTKHTACEFLRECSSASNSVCTVDARVCC